MMRDWCGKRQSQSYVHTTVRKRAALEGISLDRDTMQQNAVEFPYDRSVKDVSGGTGPLKRAW